MLRWRTAILISAAIAISYLDRQTLPWRLIEIQKDYPFSIELADGDLMGILFTGFGRPLYNPLRGAAGKVALISVQPLT